MDAVFGPKPAGAPKPLRNPYPNNVFTGALTALGNFSRDAGARAAETERQDTEYEAGIGPRPSWYTATYGEKRAAKKADIKEKEEKRAEQEAQFAALKKADRREAGEKLYDAARGVITPYECHWNGRLGRYGEPLNGKEQIEQLLNFYKGFRGLVKFDGINERSATNGRTALHGACEAGDIDMVTWLLEGFRSAVPLILVNIKDNSGLTALDVALGLGPSGTSLSDLLASHGAKRGSEISNGKCVIS